MAEVGSTVVLHVHSKFYERLDTSFIVPDTGLHPMFRLNRLVPTILRMQWSADFSGPKIRAEVFAPRGLSRVRITSVDVNFGACGFSESAKQLGLPQPCIWRYASPFPGPWQPDSTGWVNVTGRWSGWPDSSPPYGYGSGWAATVIIVVEDDLGHSASGSCGGGQLPGPDTDSRDCRFLAKPW
jgi:hypothetical protein